MNQAVNNIWPQSDRWHFYAYTTMYKYIESEYQRIKKDYSILYILNAGSGGNNYCLPDTNMMHIDIDENSLLNVKNKIISNIERMPLANNTFDLILCVGSVINYCDPLAVFSEFSRLLKSKGHLILEFESSKSLELLFNSDYNKNITLRKTFYRGEEVTIWYFSESYINRISKEYGFKRKRTKRFHIISSLMLKVFKNPKLASFFSTLDKISSTIPIIKNNCSNVICTYTKE